MGGTYSMKELKRISAFFMAMLMMLTVFSAFSVVSAEGEAAGGTQPVWPAPGSIKLDKDAAAVGSETNLWEVTLGIQGKNFETTSDVVLVIDCSGSMDGAKLDNTRQAAKAFGQKLLTEGSTTRIAIVTFIKEATAYNNGHFYGAGELAAFETAVEKATYAEGGTNQQAGLHVAQQLLNTSSAGLKNIVILSDGEATFSHPFVAAATYANCEAWTDWTCPRGGKITNIGAFAPDYSSVIGKGNSFTMDYNAKVTATCPEHGKSTTVNCVYNLDGTYTTTSGTNNGVATIWEANQAKAAGTTIYSVALQAGTNGENTLKTCATDATKDYYAIASADNVEEKLTTAFTSIAGSIAIAASNGVVNDPMGEHVKLSFSGSAPVITTDKADYDAGKADIYISQGTATYDAATRAISWTVGSVREGDNPIMKYKVGILDGYNPPTGDVLDTNKRTTFSYINYLGNDTVGEFPIPKVTVGGGAILVHWYQVNSKGEPINEFGQVVDGPAYAKQVQPAAYFEASGSTGLSYNTPYTVAATDFAGYKYYEKYIINDGSLTSGDAATVILNAANSNQHVWFAYTQSFRVGHVQFAANEQDTTVYYTEHTVELFNLTSVVSDGFIYGGAFSDRSCERVQTFAEGQNATAFTPTAGATYYIWEADAQFLSPRNLSCWNHVSENTVDVTGFYLVTPVDRLNYREVGFMVGSETLPAKQFTETYINESGVESTQVLTGSKCYVYDTVKVDLNNGTSDKYNVSNVTTNKTRGYLACYGMDKTTYWQNADAEITFTPYWITLDGVKVAPQTRTAKYLGQGPDADGNHKKFRVVRTAESGIANAFVDDAQQENMLVLMNSYFANGAPINPVDEPVQGNIVTVHDGETLYTVAAENNAVQLDYIGVEGKLFAGWFADEACTVPADLSNITESIDVYAKYVSDSYLGLRYYRNGFFRLRSLTLVSAIDGRNYAETGFIVNGERISVSDYSTRYGLRSARSLFGRGVAKDALVMSCDYAFDGVTYGARLNITPYWVTLDGTTVRGETRTLTYNWYGITE